MSASAIRILHVYRTYFPDTQGGLEEALRQICASTKPLGFEHRILTVSRQGKMRPHISFPEAEVFRAQQSFELASCNVSFKGLTLFRELSEWADIVHYQFPWPFADYLHLRSGIRKPALVTYQSDIVRQRFLGWVYRPLMQSFLSSVDIAVATSRNYLESSPVLERYKEKIQVIPNCIDESLYPVPSAENLESLKKTLPEKFFLFVGVLRYYKGLHVLLDAMKNTSAVCVIAGKGPLENELKTRVESEGLKNVIFTGYVDNETKSALYILCEGVVFPSHLRSEAFGMSLVEGAMYGKPLISTELGTGTSFINIHEKTGLVVAPSSDSSLSEALTALYINTDLSRNMGQAARQRYLEHFTPEKVGAQYARLYRKLIGDLVS